MNSSSSSFDTSVGFWFMIHLIVGSLNQTHRFSIRSAIDRINSEREFENITVIVGTKNVLLNLAAFLFNQRYIVYFTGFGRVFTDYSIFGKILFAGLIIFVSLCRVKLFIVENKADEKFIRKLSNRPVFRTDGSGFTSDGFFQKKEKKPFRYGYLARFSKSKYTNVVVNLAQSLPNDIELVIGGYDISTSNYSEDFNSLANKKSNIDFRGHIESREEISQFFNDIDVLLYPSKREGLPITIFEAIWHGVNFITTDTPGCSDLANEFNGTLWHISQFNENNLRAFKTSYKQIFVASEKLSKYENERIAQSFYEILKKYV